MPGPKKMYGKPVSMRLENFQVKFVENLARKKGKKVAHMWRDVINAGIKYFLDKGDK